MKSFSQKYEDIFLYEHYFKDYKNGFFIELGALDGIEKSNTKFFEDNFNWNGILIEPHPIKSKLLNKNRPKCYNFQELISNKIELKEYIYFDDLHASVSGIKDTLEDFHFNHFFNNKNLNNHKQSSIKLNTCSLKNIIQNINIDFIDFLSLDVEGHELEVLESWDFSIPIYLIMVEKLGKNKNKEKKIDELLFKHHYSFSAKFKHNEIFILDKYHYKYQSTFSNSFIFLNNLDQIGNDILMKKDTIENNLSIALNDDNCIAFNSKGYFKSCIIQLKKSSFLDENEGIYIKKKYYQKYILNNNQKKLLNDEKILISGTGRCGTTFLMQIFSFLNMNTGFNKNNYKNFIHDKSKSGMELNINDNYDIIKSPFFIEYIDQIITSNFKIKYMIIPIRNFKDSAKSREKHKGYDGGLWNAENYIEQIDFYQKIMSNYLVYMVKYNIPTIFLDFDKMTNDYNYLFNKLEDIFNLYHIKENDLKNIFYEVNNLYSNKISLKQDNLFFTNIINKLNNYNIICLNNDTIPELQPYIINQKLNVFLIRSDDTHPILMNNNKCIIFRTSLYKSKKQINEFIIPVFWFHKLNNNFIDYKLKSIKSIIKPSLSFCGYIHSYPKRLQWCEYLKQSSLIDCYFIYREQFMHANYKEYIQNMNQCEFCFCPRGTGNFSIRFYECLYFGRIPVVIDTDMLLFQEDEINWSNHIVFSKNIEEIPHDIVSFWNSKNIIEVQENNKILYQTYFNEKNILKYFEKSIENYFKIFDK